MRIQYIRPLCVEHNRENRGALGAEGARPSELNTRNARLEGFVARLKVSSPARSDQETLLETYVNYEDGTAKDAREFMGREFLITGDQPTYAWKLAGERSEFLGFAGQRATVEQDSTSLEAWFTTEIPIPGEPGPYGGLPGMILAVSVDDAPSAQNHAHRSAPSGRASSPTGSMSAATSCWPEPSSRKRTAIRTETPVTT